MIEINLLPEELKAKTKKMGIEPNYFLYLIPLVFGVLICVHIYLVALSITRNYQFRLLNNKWQGLEPQRKIWENFKKEHEILSADAKAIQQLTSIRINWAEKLNGLSLNLPSGVWFSELSLDRKDLVLKALVLSLQKEELNLINKFLDNLKNDNVFFKDFINLELTSVQRKTIGGYEVVDFILAGKLE